MAIHLRYWHAALGAAATVTLAGAVMPAAAQPADQPKRGGTLVFPIHMGEPNTLDCHAASTPGVMWRIAPHYSTLLQLEDDGTIKGDLARSWKISSDGLSYEFKLHPGIKFHDGSALTSRDVKVSIDRMRNPPPGVVSMRMGMYKDIKSVETPDAETVVLRLSEVNAAMLNLLATPYACILSAQRLETDASYPAKTVMGSGPFRFVRYVPGTEWVGERFDSYFMAGKPYIDGFRALTVSAAAATNAVISGQVHYNLRGLTESQIAQVLASRADQVNIVGTGAAGDLLFVVSLNTTQKPLDDVRVRRALLLALDRQAGAKAMKQLTSANVIGGLSRPGSVWARSEQELEALPGFGRDVEAARAEARRLLKEAGHPNLKLRFTFNGLYSYFAVLMADQLRQIGVTVETQTVDSLSLAAVKRSGDYDMLFDNLPEYLDDPSVRLGWFLPFKTNPLNTTRANDPLLESLYDQQKREMDTARRTVLVQKMEKHIVDNAYVIPLYWMEWQRAISKDVGGLRSMPSNFMKINLADIWLRNAGTR